MTPDGRYDQLVAQLMAEPPESRPEKKGIGSSGLFAGSKLFVMLVCGRLVVRLPRKRVDELVEAGEGVRFDPVHGRIMKEWLSLERCLTEAWLELAREAHAGRQS